MSTEGSHWGRWFAVPHSHETTRVIHKKDQAACGCDAREQGGRMCLSTMVVEIVPTFQRPKATSRFGFLADGLFAGPLSNHGT